MNETTKWLLAVAIVGTTGLLVLLTKHMTKPEVAA